MVSTVKAPRPSIGRIKGRMGGAVDGVRTMLERVFTVER